MKKYLPGETKEQRKNRKLLEKLSEKSSEIIVDKNINRYVVCLKWGTKYGPEYVNNLYSMVKRNLTLDYEFICFTDTTVGIDKKIRCEPLPNVALTGWWYKPWFLSNQLPITGTALFLDLDLIVFKNIDKLFLYKPNSNFVIIRDFNRQIRTSWDKINSSVFRYKIGHFNQKYQDFIINSPTIVKKFPGDQDWMYKNITDRDLWPDEWIQSYKWEMRGRSELGILNGKRNFKTPGVPKILEQTSIAVFHGEPNIPDCIDKWPLENWK